MNFEPDYQKIREDAEKYFSGLKPIVCPALGIEVHFCSKGFNHIVYKKGNLERNRSEQIDRFKALPIAVEIISKMTMIQEYEEDIKEITVIHQGEAFKKVKKVIYWD